MFWLKETKTDKNIVLSTEQFFLDVVDPKNQLAVLTN